MALAMLDNTKTDSSKGTSLLEAFDCKGNPVDGVHFEANVDGVSSIDIASHVPNRHLTRYSQQHR